MAFDYINVDKLLDEYSGLKTIKSLNHLIVMHGEFTMHRTYNNVTFSKTYRIKICIDSNECPKIYDVGKNINTDYPHKQQNNELCLAVHSEIINNCVTNRHFDLYKWFEKYVISFFFTYEYYNRFGFYPFGERAHGNEGVFEYYMEVFHLNTYSQVKSFLREIIKRNLKNHDLCPCGSRVKIRNCHKSEIQKAYESVMYYCIKEDLKKLK